MSQLLNTLANVDQINQTPSNKDGIPIELEDELRIYGCQLIQQAGILLNLPQKTMACGQVLFQRFWFVSSFEKFNLIDICMGSLFLSSKIEETPKRIRDLINVFDYLIKRAKYQAKHNPGPRSLELRNARGKEVIKTDSIGSNGKTSTPPPFEYKTMSYFSNEFYDTKDSLVIAEMQILKRLGFQVQVQLPYAIMVNYLQLLGLTQKNSLGNKIAQRAWSILNDALQTTIYCLFPPHLIAASSVYLTSIIMKDCPALPLEPKPWWDLLDVSEEELRIVCSHIMRLYNDDKVEDVNNAHSNSGLASRVREEWGGMIEFGEKRAIREWLAVYGKPGKPVEQT